MIRYRKSNSTIESIEQRFPDEITNWLEFEREFRIWQPETDKKKYQKPIFIYDSGRIIRWKLYDENLITQCQTPKTYWYDLHLKKWNEICVEFKMQKEGNIKEKLTNEYENENDEFIGLMGPDPIGSTCSSS